MADEHLDQEGSSGGPALQPLPPASLYRAADLGGLEFGTTADLEPLPGLSDQPRARAAIEFGTKISQRGFNISVMGASLAAAAQ